MTEHQAHVAHHAHHEPRASVLGEILEHPVEVVTAVSLSLAALLTSWSAYHAAVWDGVESAQFTRATELRTDSARLATHAGQLQGFDIFVFGQFLNAYAGGDKRLADFYQARFRREFVPAFDAWAASKPLQNPKAPASPFVLPQYQLAAAAQADQLARQADAAFERAEAAKTHSNAFIQITVVLASAMFFGGIGQVFKMLRVRLFLMAVSLLTCLWGLIRVISLPIQ